MKISTRNIFSGTVSLLTHGAVNAEVEVTTAGGDKIVAIVTESSVKSLGLAPGKPVQAFVKAPWVVLLTGTADVRFSARNQYQGKVAKVSKGAVNAEVTLELAGGSLIQAIVTNESLQEMGLAPGVAATALIKASHVILGVAI